MTYQSRNGRLLASVVVAFALSVTALPARASLADPTPGSFLAGRYIVTLAEQPLAGYEGGVSGLARTKPPKGKRVDVTTPEAKRYRDHLTDRHTKAAKAVGATPARHYSVASNAFVADLSAVQVARLMGTAGVTSVVRDELRTVADDRKSTDFLKLSGPAGVWSSLGGAENAGKGVVVGVIDTGVWPESRSLAAPALGSAAPTTEDPYRPYLDGTTTVMRKADGGTFTGTCQVGEEFDGGLCNEKLISARYFGDTWAELTPPDQRADYLSPRDRHGHGTHTATTAAGNAGVDVTVNGLAFGEISGVAPAAKIAVYKALWSSKSAEGSGYVSDLVAAVDQAVADGVDVINYSIGSSRESAADDPVQRAFLSAASTGVFVAAAGGNNGPDPASLDNTAPWVTTVAASTVAPYTAGVVLGNGARYTGQSSSVAASVGPKPLVPATSVKNADVSDADASLCQTNSLDPAKVAGKVVVCDRGVIQRPIKSAEVARAGGAGMVLVNLTALGAEADVHSVPTVHLDAPDSLTVKEYAATEGAQVTLVPGGTDTPYPQVAGFSSRGPSTTNHGDLLKPDIAAPGVAILAAVAPPGAAGREYDVMSGTSMAAPHIAGLAALYLGRYPNWSPMQIKSAMMTTATDLKTDSGAASTDRFAQGAGNVTPDRMFNPGLVYDSAEQDWLGYLEGLGIETGTGVPGIDSSDLNYPSIAIGDLFGSQTITRRVTAVAPGVYRGKIDLPGVKTTVRPSTLRFDAAGETKEFTVTFELKDAQAETLANGSLTWTGAGTTTRSPIVLTPQSVRAPKQVSGTGKVGSVSFPVTPGVTRFPITAHRPVSAPPQAGSVSTSGPDFQEFWTTVTEGAKAVEFNVRADNPQAQLGVILGYEIEGGIHLVDVLTSPADLRVSVPNPAAGRYLLVVVSLGEVEGTTSTPFTVQTNLIDGKGGKGEFTVSPKKPKVTVGVPLTVTGSWSKVSTGVRSTAFIEYPNGTGTVVTLN
ncbi:S8 family serine peptidase [Streptosporangium amethystogenes]|uniref:S8 family serine peptidase n=1 Tax=Streptosporangium amethystogenes TaxID=2002 RepID=UPI00068A1757|nr:S8 family serine peptidase [Streptosporangium amethystogenes]